MDNTIIPDAAVQMQQLLRDFGPTKTAARQMAKLLLRSVRRVDPSSKVEGIIRRTEVDFSMAVPFGFPGTHTPPLRVAAACHIFYADLAAEFRDALSNIPAPLDIVVSTDNPDKRASIVNVFKGWHNGNVDVRLVPNRGRDIAPKLMAYLDLYEDYDVVLFLHSKRGNRFLDGEPWRRYLFQTLVGSTSIVESVLEAFRSDPLLGVVMAQHWGPVRKWVHWESNFFIAQRLAKRMSINLSPAHVLDFPSGSMFWLRPAALRPLLDLDLQIEDFPEETGQWDETLAHAIERLFLFVCEAAGYRWAKICSPGDASRSSSVISIDSPAALNAYHRRHGFRLTARGPSAG